MLETFGSDYIVNGQRKLLSKVFEDCEIKSENNRFSQESMEHARTKLSIRSV